MIIMGKLSDWFEEWNCKLVVVLMILEEEICKFCGMFVWVGMLMNNEIVFDFKGVICYGCVEIEKEWEDGEKKCGRVCQKGEIRYVFVCNVWGVGYLFLFWVYFYQYDMLDSD